MFRSAQKSTTTANTIPNGITQCAYLNCTYGPQCTIRNKYCCVFILRRALLFVDAFFKRHKMPFVVIYGTLLGAVRKEKIIPWTRDIDIGYFNKTYLSSKEVRDELNQHGFHIFEVNIFI